MGTTLDTVSALTCTYAENETIKYLEPLDEYLRIIQCIRFAIQQRLQRKSIYSQALADLESKASSYRKLVAASDPKKEAQLKSKEQQMQQAEKVMEDTKSDFEKVTERLLQEFELFKESKGREIKETVIQFVTIQMDYHSKLEEEWSQILPKLQSISINSPDLYLPPPPPIPSSNPNDQYSSNPFQDFDDTTGPNNYYSSGNRVQSHLSGNYSNFHEGEENEA
jgi:hypothetical protein